MTDESKRNQLANLRILVTRPRDQAQTLCHLIEGAGARAVIIPALEICPIADIEPAKALANRLEEFDLAIFISANAVERAHDLVKSQRGWPQGLQLAVIGRRSADALVKHGLYADICPQQAYNSESLLALDEMWQVSGKKIIIFRGKGGRELLANTLRKRGATVTYAEVYHRAIPAGSREQLNHALQRGDFDIITVSSNEGMKNLYQMTDAENLDKLLQVPLVVMSHRTALYAGKIGFELSPIIAPQSSDEGLVAAIEAWYGNHKNENSRGVNHE